MGFKAQHVDREAKKTPRRAMLTFLAYQARTKELLLLPYEDGKHITEGDGCAPLGGAYIIICTHNYL